jgi:hypothetical protein
MLNKAEIIALISDTREKLQYAQDIDNVELSTNLFFALMHQYEILYSMVREELAESIKQRKQSA